MILHFALRYLFAPKKHKAVNVIAAVAVAGVAVASMAIVIVLSVFNGFSDLAHKHLAAIDPDIKVVATDGSKTFPQADSLAARIRQLPQAAAVAPILRERALLDAGEVQMPVVLMGVDHDALPAVVDVDSIIIDGAFLSHGEAFDSPPAMQAAVGVAVSTKLRPSPYTTATLYIPRRLGRINPANPAAAYRDATVTLTGVFQVNQPEYDADHAFVPIGLMRQLLEYENGEASAIAVKAAEGYTAAQLAQAIEKTLGPNFKALTRQQQQPETFRMIAVEKWVTFCMLVFILLIASFNIISTLSLMVIEKRADMATLRAMGASRSTLSNIFVAEGFLITAVGGIVGIIVGLALALVQQHWGIIKLAADPATLSITEYPVRVEFVDLALVLGTVLLTGLVISQVTRFFSKQG